MECRADLLEAKKKAEGVVPEPGKPETAEAAGRASAGEESEEGKRPSLRMEDYGVPGHPIGMQSAARDAEVPAETGASQLEI